MATSELNIQFFLQVLNLYTPTYICEFCLKINTRNTIIKKYRILMQILKFFFFFFVKKSYYFKQTTGTNEIVARSPFDTIRVEHIFMYQEEGTSVTQ